MGAEEVGSVQVYFAAEEVREFLLDRKEGQSGRVAGFEFDKNVEITALIKILPQCRAEQSQPLDVMPAAECGKPIS